MIPACLASFVVSALSGQRCAGPWHGICLHELKDGLSAEPARVTFLGKESDALSATWHGMR